MKHFKFIKVPEAVPENKQHIFNELCTEYNSVLDSACWLTNMHIHDIAYIKDLRYRRIDDVYSAISSLEAKSIDDFIPIYKRYIYHKLDIKTKAIVIGCDEWDEEDFPREKIIDSYSIVEPIQEDTKIDIPQGGAVVLDETFSYILKKSYESTERYKSIVPLLIKKCKVIVLYEERGRNFVFDPENNFDNLNISKYFSVVYDTDNEIENCHGRIVVIARK